MSDHLQDANRDMLSSISSFIAFPYIWLGSFVILGLLYRIGFFGRGLGSIVMTGLLGLLLLLPVVPGTMARFVVKPVVHNLLGREIVSSTGCLTGLASVVLAGLAIIFFLSRGGFSTAGWIFLVAPLVGGLLTIGLSLIGRGGGIRLSTGHRSAPPSVRVEKPTSKSLSDRSQHPSLPPRSKPRSSSRRSNGQKSSSSRRGRTPPPRRR
jgi:hypothetical protein